MAKLISFTTYLAVICLFFLLFSPNEVKMVEAKLCQRYSQIWSGSCGNTKHCDNQCRNWEDAKHGACHKDKNRMACFCYFGC